MTMASHNKLHLLLIGSSAISLLVWIIIAIVSALHNSPFEEGSPLHGQRYPTKIVPAEWATSLLWAVSFLWVLLAVGYTISTTYRKSCNGSYLYMDPPFTPKWTWLCATISFIFCIIWIYVAAGSVLWQGLILLFLATLGLYGAFYFASFALQKYHDRMVAIGKWREIGVTYILVHNGLVMKTTWLWVMTLVNFSATLVYFWNVAMDTACIICLVTLHLDLIVFSIVDNFVWFYRRKYVFTHYAVFVVSCIGILTRYHEPSNVVTILTYTLLVLTVISVCFKAWRTHTKVNRESPREAAKKQKKQLKKQKKLEKKLRKQGITIIDQTPGVVPEQTAVVLGPSTGGRSSSSIPTFQVQQALQPAPCVLTPQPQPLVVTNHYHHTPGTVLLPGQSAPPSFIIGGSGPPNSVNFYTPATAVVP